MSFSIGDRVIVPEDTDPGVSDIKFVLGQAGTVKNHDGMRMYAVEFDEPIFTESGKSCGTCCGRCRESHGWYCHERFLVRYEPAPTPELAAWMAYDQEEL